MSVWPLSRTDVDAYVTIALRWTEQGAVAALPADVAAVLTVVPENATDVGRRLWSANLDAVNYGGPKELCAPEVLAELEEFPEDVVPLPDYEFEPLPGLPAPETAVRRAHYYRYQTAGDYWETEAQWAGGVPPFEMLFTQAVEWFGNVQLGTTTAARPERFGTTTEGPDLRALPKYEQSGWQLGEDDRDLFVRLA